MIVDDVQIRVKAGDGGDGAVAFNKNLMTLGPVGGNGGNGGSIYVEAVAELDILNQFRFKKEIKAQDGDPGRGQSRDGSEAVDITLKIPVGTVIHNLTLGVDSEMTRIGERVVLAKGGRGGRGNYVFRSPTNQSPKEFEKGTPGQEFDIRFELKLIADIGLIGLPNVGKSNLLNELTNANSKVANYPFTTLEPNLGVYYELILADIPGLIEGASQGKGLGIKFLRHIERTKVLFHLVDAESLDPVHDYKTVREEMKIHNPLLLKKDEYVFLSKSDNVSKDEVKKKVMLLKPLNKHAYSLSLLEPKTVEKVKDILNKIKAKKIIVIE
ncbi:MAG: hypothetical protein A2Z96_03605 [Spirochaetes bacterium GWB1_48_6]|nr:MAG: GTPase obg [Parcubacteria group bacterium GW2011_GWF1_45_5]OHD12206.1 MAG: hypothetical protein A2Z96_03605 [Spirochaetes bacterium GWB1_48_6]